MGRCLLAVVALVVSGCASGAPRLDVIVASVPHVAAPVVDVCAEVQREENVPADGDTGVLGVRFFCAPTPAGAWAVRIDPPVDGAADLALVAIHAEREGARSREAIKVAGAAPWWPTLAPIARGVTMFDFDGDGEPELFVRVTRLGLAEYGVGQFFVTSSGGPTVPYAPAAALAIEGFEDVDGDGRPDARLAAHRYAHARSDGTFWAEKSPIPASADARKLEAATR